MTRISLANAAHQQLAAILHPGDIAIDATTGNGHDTLFLAQQVGASGLVYGFDIQAAALNNTRERLHQHDIQTPVRLLAVSHAEMQAHIPPDQHGKIQAVMFNFGYLPGADKSVITQTDSSLQAVQAACELLAAGGIITLTVYPGHAGGDVEAQAIEQFCLALPAQQFQIHRLDAIAGSATAPRLFVIQKSA